MIRRLVSAWSDTETRATKLEWLIHQRATPGVRGMVAVERLGRGDRLEPQCVGKLELASFVLRGACDWLESDGSLAGRLEAGQALFNAPGTCRGFSSAPGGALLLTIYGNGSDPGEVRAEPAGPALASGRVIRDEADTGEGVLGRQGGFVDMGVQWLATTETVGSKSIVLATSTFTPGGSHDLHRHHHADEFFMLLDGGGDYLSEHGAERLEPGDMTFIPVGEWHGFRTDPGVTTHAVYGYLGAGNLERAGYELRRGAA